MVTSGGGAAGGATDPVRARRRALGRLAKNGKRLGYGLFGLAIAAFFVALLRDFPEALVTLVVASLAVGSLVLAPAIVVGYGVRAAEREDRTPSG